MRAAAAALCLGLAAAGSAAAQENCAARLSPGCLETLGAGAAAIESDRSCAAQIAGYRDCLSARAAAGPGRPPSPEEEAAAQAAYEAVKDRGDPAKLELVARRFPNTFWGELAAEDAAAQRKQASPRLQSDATFSDASLAGAAAGLAAKAESEKGAWAKQVDFTGAEPALFSHYFVIVDGSDWIARGAIVTGARWDQSESPLFRVVRGYLAPASDKSWHVAVSRLAYLGPRWRPEYAELSDVLFSKGGKALADYIDGP